jgi:hypothetical protein
MTDLIHSYAAEWLKLKRSLALWMVLIGGFFTPALVTIARLVSYSRLPQIYSRDENFWASHWQRSWESMAIFFLPLGAILATSLVAQLEYKNNTWKQLHTLPVAYSTIFAAKLGVILTLLLIFLVLFNIGIYLSALLPYLVMAGTFDASALEGVPTLSTLHSELWLLGGQFVGEDLLYFVDTLPIVGLQYLLALRYKNFLVPVGLGFLFWVGAIAGVSWSYGYAIPYTYPMFNYLKAVEKTRAVHPEVNIHIIAAVWSVVFIAAGLILYVTRKEKG